MTGVRMDDQEWYLRFLFLYGFVFPAAFLLRLRGSMVLLPLAILVAASVHGEFAFVCQCEPYALVPFLLLLPLLKRKRRMRPAAGAAISDHLDGRTALTEVQWSLLEDPFPKPTCFWCSAPTTTARCLVKCATHLPKQPTHHWLGTTTEAVTANDHTIEAEPGLSAIAYSSRSVRAVPPWSSVPTHIPKAWRT